MWDPARGRLRVARAVAAGTSVAAIAAGSHILGGGGHSSWLAVVPATIAVALVAWSLAGRRLTDVALLGMLGLAQVGVHGLSAHLAAHPAGHGGEMLLAHLAGAAVTAAVLARGERALWWLHAWLRPRTLPRPHRAPAVRAAASPAGAAPVLPLLAAGACSRRGPPVGRS